MTRKPRFTLAAAERRIKALERQSRDHREMLDRTMSHVVTLCIHVERLVREKEALLAEKWKPVQT